MNSQESRSERRSIALSSAQIVRAAVEVLDEGGADALTFRMLASRLSTGAGAIYHHIAGKGELLSGAASDVIAQALAEVGHDTSEQGLRDVMLSVFDAITARPWVGTQLAAAPWQPAVLQLFERVGSELASLRVPEQAQFDAASVLVQHLIGVASQVDASTRLTEMKEEGRSAFLKSATTDLLGGRGAERFPFLDRISLQLENHDDREQFRAGVDIILAGISALGGHPVATRPGHAKEQKAAITDTTRGAS